MPPSPLGTLLVEHSATALLASDGVRAPQRELETAVAAEVVHDHVFLLDVAVPAGRRILGAGRGDLVLFARHFSAVFGNEKFR